jgi:mono/diheme cytochrome c family protein
MLMNLRRSASGRGCTPEGHGEKGKYLMQVKVAIGTIALMLTMVVFGYAAIRETARMERFTAAQLGRSIERGAHLYDANCVNCHGIDGRAEVCYDPGSGEQIGCIGLQLNSQALLCGDTSERMRIMNWDGTKEAFILSTISAGRMGTQMVKWSEQFGGPLRQDQVGNLTTFVLNWETEELCSGEIVRFDWPDSAADFVAEYPDGDAASGKSLYVTYGCLGCHGIPDEGIVAAIGPTLVGIREIGAARIEGMTALQYVYESILHPSDYIAPECPNGPCTGPPSAMPANFGDRMAPNPTEMTHLLTYLGVLDD